MRRGMRMVVGERGGRRRGAEKVGMFIFFKQKTAYEISACLVGSKTCIRDRDSAPYVRPGGSLMSSWTPERRARQAELIRTWRPWKQSTGPRSSDGKERVSRNAWKGGHRAQLRELTKMVNEHVQSARELANQCK